MVSRNTLVLGLLVVGVIASALFLYPALQPGDVPLQPEDVPEKKSVIRFYSDRCAAELINCTGKTCDAKLLGGRHCSGSMGGHPYNKMLNFHVPNMTLETVDGVAATIVGVSEVFLRCDIDVSSACGCKVGDHISKDDIVLRVTGINCSMLEPLNRNICKVYAEVLEGAGKVLNFTVGTTNVGVCENQSDVWYYLKFNYALGFVLEVEETPEPVYGYEISAEEAKEIAKKEIESGREIYHCDASDEGWAWEVEIVTSKWIRPGESKEWAYDYYLVDKITKKPIHSYGIATDSG